MEKRKSEGARLTESAVKRLLSTKEGCFFLGLLLSRSGVDEPSIDVNNMYLTCANEGRRALGLWLKRLIKQYCGAGACSKCVNVFESANALDKARRDKEAEGDVFGFQEKEGRWPDE